jgi:hypothetical protein
VSIHAAATEHLGSKTKAWNQAQSVLAGVMALNTEWFHTELIRIFSEAAGRALKNGSAISWDDAEKIARLVHRAFADEATKRDNFDIRTIDVVRVNPDSVRDLDEAEIEWGMLPWFDECDGDFEISSPSVPLSEVMLRSGGRLEYENHLCARSIEDSIHAVSLSVEAARQKLAQLRADGKAK